MLITFLSATSYEHSSTVSFVPSARHAIDYLGHGDPREEPVEFSVNIVCCQ